MENAILYTRVSTDEQANRGFSLPYQKEVLTRFCTLKNINVIKHFQEDYSAKTFDRPDWKKLIVYVKANRKNIDVVLFTRWDRFSRNIAEAYQVIKKLHDMGVTVNSIEQPLDLTISDNKVILAIYLAIPEVENDKISIRTREGSRKANQLGCWTTVAPIGYKNYRTEDGKSSLIPSGKAPLIYEAFKTLADTQKPVETVRKIMLKKGLKISRTRFYHLVRNYAYVGKVKVPAYKDEEVKIVEALHDAIVPISLFNTVQDVLNGKVRKTKKYSFKNEDFPLRGHISCSRCGKTLTGSTSKGNGGLYYYYHCTKGCNERFKTAEAHEKLETLIGKVKLTEDMSNLVYAVLSDEHKSTKFQSTIKVNKLDKSIAKINTTIEQAENNLFEGKIDQDTFVKVKQRYAEKRDELTQEKSEISNVGKSFLKTLKRCLHLFNNLDKLYRKSDWEGKQRLLGLIFPKKLVFKKGKIQTIKLNYALEHITMISNEITGIKKGQSQKNSGLSSAVTPTGFKPVTLRAEI